MQQKQNYIRTTKRHTGEQKPFCEAKQIHTINNQYSATYAKSNYTKYSKHDVRKQTSKSQEKQNRSLCVSPIVTDGRQNCSDRYRCNGRT